MQVGRLAGGSLRARGGQKNNWRPKTTAGGEIARDFF